MQTTNTEAMSLIFLSLDTMFVSQEEIELQISKLNESQANLVNSIINEYGFNPNEYAIGDPRGLLESDELTNHLGFCHNEFGVFAEFELTQPDTYENVTEDEVLKSTKILTQNTELKIKEVVTKHPKTKFLFTTLEGCGLSLLTFTPLIKNEQNLYALPYESNTALQDLIEDVFCALDGE